MDALADMHLRLVAAEARLEQAIAKQASRRAKFGERLRALESELRTARSEVAMARSRATVAMRIREDQRRLAREMCERADRAEATLATERERAEAAEREVRTLLSIHLDAREVDDTLADIRRRYGLDATPAASGAGEREAVLCACGHPREHHFAPDGEGDCNAEEWCRCLRFESAATPAASDPKEST